MAESSPGYEGQEEAQRRELDRVGAFSDGVFAIAITLLVLNIEVPSGGTAGDALEVLDDDLIAYFIGFAVIGKFWYEHHKLFSAIVRSNGKLIAVNLLLLCFVALMPFTTNVLGSFNEPLAVSLYAINVALTTVASCWTEAVAHDDELTPPGALGEKSTMVRAAATVVTIFLLSIPVAYLISPLAGQLFWLTLLVIPRVPALRGG